MTVAGKRLRPVGQKPEEAPEGAGPEDLLEIARDAQVVRVSPRLAFLFGLALSRIITLELERRLVGQDQEQVEASQERERTYYGKADHKGYPNASLAKICKAWRGAPHKYNRLTDVLQETHKDKDARERQEEEKQAKVPVIVEANTIVNPGAVVVHLQDAPPAYAAVMASGRLKSITPSALPRLLPTLLLPLLQDLLVQRGLSWICSYRLVIIVKQVQLKEHANDRQVNFASTPTRHVDHGEEVSKEGVCHESDYR